MSGEYFKQLFITVYKILGTLKRLSGTFPILLTLRRRFVENLQLFWIFFGKVSRQLSEETCIIWKLEKSHLSSFWLNKLYHQGIVAESVCVINTSDYVIRRIKYFFYWFQIQKPQAVKNLLKRPQLWLLWWQKNEKEIGSKIADSV